MSLAFQTGQFPGRPKGQPTKQHHPKEEEAPAGCSGATQSTTQKNEGEEAPHQKVTTASVKDIDIAKAQATEHKPTIEDTDTKEPTTTEARGWDIPMSLSLHYGWSPGRPEGQSTKQHHPKLEAASPTRQD